MSVPTRASRFKAIWPKYLALDSRMYLENICDSATQASSGWWRGHISRTNERDFPLQIFARLGT